MLLLLITAADEPSKVPFYIVGGLLASRRWSWPPIGMQRPNFPSSDRGAARRDRASAR